MYVPGTLGSPNFAEVPLNTAWNNLRNAVAKKVFKINVQFDKNVSRLFLASIARRYMTGIWLIRRITQDNQPINQSINQSIIQSIAKY